jgi:glycosyltransferase involved in cell wall biosynthesis
VKILHIITDLNGYGGTENTLLRYLSSSAAPGRHVVFVLKTCGEENTAGASIRKLGVPVHEFHVGEPRGLITFPYRFARQLRAVGPTVISAWLYHPILLAELFKWVAHRPRVIWHIRNLPSYAEGGGMRNTFRKLFLKLVGATSNRCRSDIVTNSQEAAMAHQRIGYRKTGWHVVPNGIDFDEYVERRKGRAEVRGHLGIDDDQVVIIAVGRFAPEKGYAYLFQGLARSRIVRQLRSTGKVRFLGIGHGVSEDNPQFVRLCDEAFDRSERVLLGRRSEVSTLLAAGDLFILSSVTESFPNTLIEAVAAGLPVVATQVGGVGELGLCELALAIPRDSQSIAARVDWALTLDDAELASMTETHSHLVRRRYSVRSMTTKLDTLISGDAQ